MEETVESFEILRPIYNTTPGHITPLRLLLWDIQISKTIRTL